MDKSDISVIISCHNLETYLPEAIASVKQQTIAPREIIVVHDGCDKPTATTGTTTLFREDNRGVAQTRHEGVLISKGQQILFLDADDMIPELFFNEMLATLASGADIAYPDILMWSAWGESEYQNAMHWPPKHITFNRLYVNNQIVVTSLMKRKVYEAIGGFDHDLPIYEDWAFWLEAMVRGYVFKKADTYLKYRQRTASRNHQPDELKRETCKAVHEKYISHLKKKKVQ